MTCKIRRGGGRMRGKREGPNLTEVDEIGQVKGEKKKKNFILKTCEGEGIKFSIPGGRSVESKNQQ